MSQPANGASMKRSGSTAPSASAAVKGETTSPRAPRVKKEEDDVASPRAADAAATSSSVKAEANGHASTNGIGKAGTPSSASRQASPPPPTGYRDFPVYSSKHDDCHFHLMRLASHSAVDPSDTKQFPWPVKLNRKLPPRLKENAPRVGDPVVDQFGRPIMAPPKAGRSNDPNVLPQDKRKVPLRWPEPDGDYTYLSELLARIEAPKGPQADASLIGPSNTSNNATRSKAGIFKKRVREVHKASSVARKTHNEEALPWILEDHETEKEWEGRRKESRRGFNAFKEAVEARKEKGTPFPTRPSLEQEEAAKTQAASTVKKEDPGVKDEADAHAADAGSSDNHAPWIGKLEGEAHESGSTSAGGAMSHALFVFDNDHHGAFRVVPVSRMYKFIQKPKYASKMSWEEAEKAFEKHQKARMGESISKWIARDNEGSLAPGTRRLRDEPSGSSGYASLSLPGAAPSRSSSSRHSFMGNSAGGIGDLYDRDSSARRSQFRSVRGDNDRGIRVKDEEGTYGELAFEEDFADDEERNEGDDYAMGEEETKELEQRMKRELARAEERHELGEDEDDFADDLFGDRGRPGQGENDVLTGSGKQMKKIMKALARREGNEAYEDDEADRNPYASDDSDEDDVEDSVMANPEEALRLVREEREREQREQAKLRQQQGNGSTTSAVPSKETSRSGTPAPQDRAPSSQSRPGTAGSGTGVRSSNVHRPGAGHANVAQRATSPTRAQSRSGSRSGSPDTTGIPPSSSSSLKRKSDLNVSTQGGAAQAGGQAASGKRARMGTGQSASSRTSSPGSGSPRSASPSRSGGRMPLNDVEREIIELVRTGSVSTTKDLIAYFAPRLSLRLGQGTTLRQALLEGAKRVLQTSKAGTLEVRPNFRE